MNRLQRGVVGTCAALYVVGVVLLCLAVYVDLPGPLDAYADPHAWWPFLVQVALAAAGFGTWWWTHRRRSLAFSLVFLGLGTITVLALGTAGYASCPDPQGSDGWKVVVRIIGLMLNNYDTDMFGNPGCPPEAPLALQFARLAQVVVLLVAGTRAVAALLRNQLDRLFVRFSPRVVLAIGVDEQSSVLLGPMAADRGRATLATVTQDPSQPWVFRARSAGWRIVVGDPEDAGLLKSLVVHRGRRTLRSLAVLAADSIKAQRLMNAVERAVAGSTAGAPVRALLRIDDSWQAEDWRRRYLGRIEQWIVDTVSGYEVTARLLLDDALSRGADRLVIVGHGDLTFALLGEMAQQARERSVLGLDDGIPPVVLVDPRADDVLDEHAFAQARFGNSAGVDVRAVASTNLLVDVQAAVDGADEAAVVFTGDPDLAEQRLAARLGATRPGLLIYSRRAEVSGVGPDPLLAQVRAYGVTLDAGGERPVDSWERIARLVHERFVRANPDPTIPSRRGWDDGLPELYRSTNVRQVLSLLTSAVEHGRSWGATDEETTPPGPELLEALARDEHESWRRHLGRFGWRWAATRDDAAQRHPDLLPWEELSEASREKTRSGVLASLELLATLGYRSFDDPDRRWRSFRRTGEVVARRHDEPWTWHASDGVRFRGEAGDWEVVGTNGSRSVKDDVFRRTHSHVDGETWRRTGVLQARPARPGERVQSLEGSAIADVDQWVMRGVLGEEWLVAQSHLDSAYEPVD